MYHWHTTCRFSATTLFLFQQMWSMVCSHYANASIGKSFAQHKLIDGSFYAGINLNTTTQALLVKLCKEQVTYTSLGSNLCSDSIATRTKEFKFLGSRDMCYMQLCTIFLSQSHRFLSRSQTGLLRTYHGMQTNRRIFSPCFLFSPVVFRKWTAIAPSFSRHTDV